MLYANDLRSLISSGRVITKDVVAARGNPVLGALKELPGTWSNAGAFAAHAWNMIALPFGTPGTFGDFRLLLNQANEQLDFNLVDLGVRNRGINRNDQILSVLRYMQTIDQEAAIDAVSLADGSVKVPATDDNNDTPKGNRLHPGPDVPDASVVGIHREPGLFLHVSNLAGPCANLSQPGPDLGRLANIPHGDTVLAMSFDGNAAPVPGGPDLSNAALVAAFSPLPIGLGTTDIANPYFGPYKQFKDNPFKGSVTAAGFPGFDPTDPLNLLRGVIQAALPGASIVETTTFTVDTTVSGGITNIPFVICQANSTRVTATFWIQKVQYGDKTCYVLQYAQRVVLEFFPRGDGLPGLIQWPHISINTMIRE